MKKIDLIHSYLTQLVIEIKGKPHYKLLTYSVIVIDDDEDTVRLFSEFLEENGIKVVGNGYDGKEAVRIYKEKKPDAVLIDIMMPNGSGFYAIKQIRDINPDAKIIAVTADMSPATEEKLDALNVPKIYKPFKMENVINAIKS